MFGYTSNAEGPDNNAMMNAYYSKAAPFPLSTIQPVGGDSVLLRGEIDLLTPPPTEAGRPAEQSRAGEG